MLVILFIQFQVSSYGGYLTYQVKSFGLPGDMVPLEKRPDVQLTVGTRVWAEQREASCARNQGCAHNQGCAYNQGCAEC